MQQARPFRARFALPFVIAVATGCAASPTSASTDGQSTSAAPGAGPPSANVPPGTSPSKDGDDDSFHGWRAHTGADLSKAKSVVARNGVAYVLVRDRIHVYDGTAWSAIALPEATFGFSVVLPRDDGSICASGPITFACGSGSTLTKIENTQTEWAFQGTMVARDSATARIGESRLATPTF